MGPDLRAGVSRLSPSFMASLTARASGSKQRLTIADRGILRPRLTSVGTQMTSVQGWSTAVLRSSPETGSTESCTRLAVTRVSWGYRESHRWFLLPEVRNTSSDSPRGRKSPKPKLLECPRRMGPTTGLGKRKRTI